SEVGGWRIKEERVLDMEPPRGVWASLWNFIWFLPYFVGLLILGVIKGLILCPLICLIMTVGNSAIILGLWPVHCLWTYYSILITKQFGPVLKLVLCVFIAVPLMLWPPIAIVNSVIGGAAYGLLAPIFATFKAVGEGKTNELFHCIYDGTWDTVQGSFTVIRDFGDVCFHSYLSIMHDLRHQGPPEGKYYEIRLIFLPGAVIAGFLGVMVDFPVISLVALFKSPYMLFKGWHRLFHDCIGREGPFLETICVPFAGLAILLWPLAVVGAVLGSMVASLFLGAYAAVIVYKVRSPLFGQGFAILLLPCPYMMNTATIFLTCLKAPAFLGSHLHSSVLNIYASLLHALCFNNLSRNFSCLKRPQYQKKAAPFRTSSFPSFSRPDSFRSTPSRSGSSKNPMIDLKPLELLDSLFKECQHHGEIMVSEGLITLKDIEDARSNKDSGRIISIGLPAYCLLQALLRSARSNSAGLLLSDNVTEITSTNRPKDTFFEWFFSPLLIIKDQLRAQNLSETEEDYLGKLVLLCGDHERLKSSNIGSPPKSDLRQAEFDALARRLQGITKSMSRYPTFRRRFDASVKMISEDLAKKNVSTSSGGPRTVPRSRSTFARIFSQKSFRNKTSNRGSDQEAQPAGDRDVEIV
ncbi:hypothetical protein RJ639_016004, partial [Escallonia herrerae]